MVLIIPMIIQTIHLYPSGAVWTDGPSNVSSLDPSGAIWSDAEHPARKARWSTDAMTGETHGRFKRWFWRPPRPHGEIIADRQVSFLEGRDRCRGRPVRGRA
jgi:hypothetical protein